MNAKKILQARLDNINESLGTKYYLDYNPVYKGWKLYENEDGIICAGKIGTLSPLSSGEMLAYLDGILGGLRVTNTNKNNNEGRFEEEEKPQTKTYSVRIYLHTFVDFEVEAETKEDAIDIAENTEYDMDQLLDNMTPGDDPDAEEIINN